MKTRFFSIVITAGWALAVSGLFAADPAADEPERLKPIGEAKGIHPGRVVWVHDRQVLDWKGPGDGHWYEVGHTKQDRVD
jgi:hypothetical protein